MKLDEIKSLLPSEAINLLNDYIAVNPKDDEAYTLRGMKHWAMGEHSAAINDYLAAIKINPEGKAKHALEAAESVMNYYNKDLLNP